MVDRKQNDIAQMRTEGIDLAPRWEEILTSVSEQIGFIPSLSEMRHSQWWKTGKVGAVSVHGKLSEGDTSAVLKIQGTHPPTSEYDMVNEFSCQNESKQIRPPHIYGFIPWSEEKQFEAIVFEDVKGDVAISHHPATDKELNRFFNLIADYRQNCRNNPWITRPTEWSYADRYNRWRGAVEEQILKDQFVKPEDVGLAQKGIEIVSQSHTVDNLEFVHGHLAAGDFIITESGDAVLFSNLFWGWRSPFYDYVFAYHWWMLGMEHAENLTEGAWKEEQERWLSKMYDLPEIKESKKNERLLTIARLERAIPALMVDRFMMNQERKSAGLITRLIREETKSLIKKLS